MESDSSDDDFDIAPPQEPDPSGINYIWLIFMYHL